MRLRCAEVMVVIMQCEQLLLALVTGEPCDKLYTYNYRYSRPSRILVVNLFRYVGVKARRTCCLALCLSLLCNALQKINDMAYNQFEQEEDYMTPLRVVLQTVLPILDTIQGEASDENNVVGVIKDRWVNLLMEELQGKSCYPTLFISSHLSLSLTLV